MNKKIKVLDAQMPIKDQEKLIPILRSYKWQINFQMPNGKIRFGYTDKPDVAEKYMKANGFKILKVQEVKK